MFADSIATNTNLSYCSSDTYKRGNELIKKMVRTEKLRLETQNYTVLNLETSSRRFLISLGLTLKICLNLVEK